MIMENGELKKRYKRTEVGVIPEDWGVDKIKNLASIGTGSRNTQDRTDDGEFPFFVRSQKAERINSYSFDGEAVLTAGDGVGTGKVFHYIIGKFDYHQRVYKISNFKPELDGFYFYKYFSSRFYDRIMSMTAKSSVDSVRMEMIADMDVPLPEPKEQYAISTALSDVDALIAGLDKLIAKKRAIKTAAMQQLLTGKRRLPGFCGQWKLKRIGDLLKVRHGKSQNSIADENGDYPILATSGEIGRTNSCLYEKPSVLIGRKGTINKPQYIERPFWTIDTLFYTEIEENNYPRFIFYKFCTINWLNYNEASGVPSLNASTLEAIEFICPERDEQLAIATILTNMDAEITALESRRNKTQAIKQGMMQELLTGRTRLI